jgi:hypothetical protein
MVGCIDDAPYGDKSAPLINSGGFNDSLIHTRHSSKNCHRWARNQLAYGGILARQEGSIQKSCQALSPPEKMPTSEYNNILAFSDFRET